MDKPKNYLIKGWNISPCPSGFWRSQPVQQPCQIGFDPFWRGKISRELSVQKYFQNKKRNFCRKRGKICESFMLSTKRSNTIGGGVCGEHFEKDLKIDDRAHTKVYPTRFAEVDDRTAPKMTGTGLTLGGSGCTRGGWGPCKKRGGHKLSLREGLKPFKLKETFNTLGQKMTSTMAE